MSVVTVVGFAHPPLSRPRSVVAIAKIRITFDNQQITLDDLRIVRNRQGQLWVALPAMKNEHGMYEPIVEFSPDLREQISTKVLAGHRQWSVAASAQSAQMQIGGGAR